MTSSFQAPAQPRATTRGLFCHYASAPGATEKHQVLQVLQLWLCVVENVPLFIRFTFHLPPGRMVSCPGRHCGPTSRPCCACARSPLRNVRFSVWTGLERDLISLVCLRSALPVKRYESRGVESSSPQCTLFMKVMEVLPPLDRAARCLVIRMDGSTTICVFLLPRGATCDARLVYDAAILLPFG